MSFCKYSSDTPLYIIKENDNEIVPINWKTLRHLISVEKFTKREMISEMTRNKVYLSVRHGMVEGV